MSDNEENALSATEQTGSLKKLIGVSGGVIALIATGILVGAVLWPRAVTVEQRVVAPIRQAAARATTDQRLPDLVDAACPAIVTLVGAPVPAPASTSSPKKATDTTDSDAIPANGILVSADGDILTSEAVIGDATSVKVQLADGRSFDADVGERDTVAGLVLLKIDATNLPALDFADADFPRIGTWGFNLSSPLGTGCIVDTGVVSGDFAAEGAGPIAYIRARPMPETEIVGAPFIGADGKVIGLAVRGPDQTGLILIPGKTVSHIVSGLLRGRTTSGEALGFLTDDLTPVLSGRLHADRQRGAVVVLIKQGSSADKAGLKVGDVILAAGDSPVSGVSELARALDTSAKSIDLTVARSGEHLTVTLHQR